jgi:hypothetical protein
MGLSKNGRMIPDVGRFSLEMQARSLLAMGHSVVLHALKIERKGECRERPANHT